MLGQNILAKNSWPKPGNSPTVLREEWMSKRGYIHATEHYVAIKEQTAAACNNMDEFQKHYAEFKKANRKNT